jgi:hypothetical protein
VVEAVSGNALLGGDGDVDEGLGRSGSRCEQGGDEGDKNAEQHGPLSFGDDTLILLLTDPNVQAGDGGAILAGVFHTHQVVPSFLVTMRRAGIQPVVLLDLWYCVVIIMPKYRARLTTTAILNRALWEG